MPERFVSEPIRPLAETMDTTRMAAGEPGLPGEFSWREKRIVIRSVRKTWRTVKSCHHGSGEKYVRKHWYEVVTSDDSIMKIYFDRQPEGGRQGMGWWLFSVRAPEPEDIPPRASPPGPSA